MACAGTALSGQATFLEQFLESAKVLPADVRRQLQLLRVLDFKYQQEFERLKDARKAFLHKVNKLQSGSVDELKELRNMENDLNILSLEKIEAAKALNQIVTFEIYCVCLFA
jgi:cell division protein FtsB